VSRWPHGRFFSGGSLRERCVLQFAAVLPSYSHSPLQQCARSYHTRWPDLRDLDAPSPRRITTCLILFLVDRYVSAFYFFDLNISPIYFPSSSTSPISVGGLRLAWTRHVTLLIRESRFFYPLHISSPITSSCPLHTPPTPGGPATTICNAPVIVSTTRQRWG
jgi:hypothetical protein